MDMITLNELIFNVGVDDDGKIDADTLTDYLADNITLIDGRDDANKLEVISRTIKNLYADGQSKAQIVQYIRSKWRLGLKDAIDLILAVTNDTTYFEEVPEGRR